MQGNYRRVGSAKGIHCTSRSPRCLKLPHGCPARGHVTSNPVAARSSSLPSPCPDADAMSHHTTDARLGRLMNGKHEAALSAVPLLPSSSLERPARLGTVPYADASSAKPAHLPDASHRASSPAHLGSVDEYGQRPQQQHVPAAAHGRNHSVRDDGT
nr:hypothetical protein CFP56_08103 [Quercus suber]